MNEEAEPLESPGGFARLLAVLSAGAIAVILGSAGEVAQVLPAFWTSFITAALMGFFGSLISSVVALWSLLSVRLRVDIERESVRAMKWLLWAMILFLGGTGMAAVAAVAWMFLH